MELRQMWVGGPLRNWSPEREDGTLAHATGFVGAYVCSACWNPVHGVYRVPPGVWVCPECRERGKLPPERPHPALFALLGIPELHF